MGNKHFRLKKWLLTVLFVAISVVFSGIFVKIDSVSAQTAATPAAGTATAPGSTVTPPATVAPSTAPKDGVSVGLPLPTVDDNGNVVEGKTTSYKKWNEYFSDFYKFALIVGASLGILMIVWAGYLYMFSAGDATKMNAAKEYILGAIIGLALLYLINYLAALLGICNINGKAC